MRLINLFIQEHYVDHKLLGFHLQEFGFKQPIFIHQDSLWHPRPYPKREHAGFNILYYYPRNKKNKHFIDWLYGRDIYLELKQRLDGINWIVVDGSFDMREVFPIVDFYLRPTRHDGSSRLRRECEINKIPLYWSQQDPDIEEIIEEIEKCRPL